MIKSAIPMGEISWDQKELDAIQQVIASGQYTMGKQVALCEQGLAAYLGTKFCVMVNSGSSANLLMIAALFFKKENPLKRGDEVIVPAVGWSTSYYPLQQYGLKLRFVDVNLETLNYDVQALQAAITSETKLILAVNMLGNPNDFNAIKKIITKHNIYLLEDNCEALGAEYESKKTGTFGCMASYSSYFSHHFSTIEGGFISTEDEELYHILMCLRSHGWTRNLPNSNAVTGHKNEDDFEETFNFVLPGYNVKPQEFSGAIGVEQLKKIDRFMQNRRANAKLFLQEFGESSDYFIQKEIGSSSWFGFSFVLKPDSKYSRRELVAKLRNNGIDCRPILSGNFTKQAVLKYFNYEIAGTLFNADHIHTHGFYVGNSHNPMQAKINTLKAAFE